jgi:hypothetical protein
MKPRRSCLVAIAIGMLLLAAAPLLHSRVPRDVAMLERLAPRIERAHVIAPDARDVIQRLVQRVSESIGDHRHEPRRQVAIERVAAALQAKGAMIEPSSIGQRQGD